jgi:RNA recognition motif. (a.k.a. RRM, RBD, or RNP domain)
MSNLPYEASENDVVGFFAEYGVTLQDVSLQRRAETGQVHAAVVKFRDATTASGAMGLDGAQFGGRTAHLKIDGADRRSSGGSRGGGFSSGNFVPHGVSSPPGYGDAGQWGGRERRSYGSSGFGGASPRDGAGDGGGFGSRERKGYGGSSGQYEPAGAHHGGGPGGRDREDGGSGRERRGPGMQADDPTIPQGPPPEGRKRLQLKPRTKPPPKLDIDTRQIDPPARSHAAPRSGAAAEDGEDRGARVLSRGTPGIRSKNENLSPAGAAAKRTEPAKESANTPDVEAPNGVSPALNGVGSRTGKEEEKPKLQNPFDALNTEEKLDGAES